MPRPHPDRRGGPRQPAARRAASLPVRAGIGLREPHVPAFLDAGCPAPWVEIHSENYLVPGGPRLARLDRVRAERPISCHGVGLSLGSAGGLDPDHLMRLRALFDRVEPAAVSDHLAWTTVGGVYLNDLLPLPYTQEALAVLCANVAHAQDVFGRPILVENPSAYMAFAESVIPEPDFLAELVRRTGCGLLLDVNNIYVSACNLGTDPHAYLAAVPADAVGEYHLAGHARATVEGEALLIDDHGSPVCDAVLALFAAAVARIGPRPALIEWDTALPALADLLAEAGRVQAAMDAAASPAVARAHAG